MSDLSAARAKFLARVEELASGQSARFAPALDALIAWSQARDLVFAPPSASQFTVRFRRAGEKTYLWVAMPRSGDGAKLTLGGPEGLLAEARSELARIDAKPVNEHRPPELAFTYLIWGPHREAVLTLLGKLLTGAAEGSADPVALAAHPAAS